MTDYITPEQAAELLPVGNPDWIRAQLKRGKIEGSKIGGRWVTTEAAIHAFVARSSNNTRRKNRSVA